MTYAEVQTAEAAFAAADAAVLAWAGTEFEVAAVARAKDAERELQAITYEYALSIGAEIE